MGARTQGDGGMPEEGIVRGAGMLENGAMGGYLLYKRYAKLYKGSPDSATPDP